MVQVLPGAEAWSAPGGDVGALLLHGFTGNPVSLRPLAEALAAEGFAVELPRLPGHGTRWQDLQRTTWHDWAREAAAAFALLRARTRARVVVGLSMGGALALRLAATRGEEVAGLALINPWIRYSDRRRWLLPVAKRVLPSAAGVGSDIAKAGADERAYDRVPLRAFASVLQLQRRVRADLARVAVPTLVLTSRVDHTVDTDSSRVVMDGIGSADREQRWLERSYHVATLDHDAPVVEAAVATFARRVTGR